MHEPPVEMDLSVSPPLEDPPDDSTAIARYPVLAEFRERLGNTPLEPAPGPPGGAAIVAKHEFGNPFGSVKDRPAYALLCGAIDDHGDAPEPLRLVDFSGGNMARALSGLGALTGIPIRLAVPEAIAPSLQTALKEDGTELDFVPSDQFLYGIMRRAAAIAAEEPGWTLLHQHRNVRNVAVHQFGTGGEILRQLGSEVAGGWVAAIGTGGTLAGVDRALRSRFPDLAVTGVSPEELPYGTAEPPNARRKFPGSGGIGYGFRQPFVDRFMERRPAERTVSYERALAAMNEFRDLTGLSIGPSSAANWLVAWDLAERMPPGRTVVTLFADAGTVEDWANAEAIRA
ncbi:pyridoxal-phosphate dependent enzyme [Spirillospora sp. NBC_00431]